MREYPVTITSRDYQINSSASRIFGNDRYEEKLPTTESIRNCGRFHDKLGQCNNNTGTNFTRTIKSDASQNDRLRNFNIPNNNCNNSHKTAINSFVKDERECEKNDNRTSNGNASYSIFDAITSAVTTGNCVNSVYPSNDATEVNVDQINHNPDALNGSTPIENIKNIRSNLDKECGQFQHYNYLSKREHHFPSTNYKHCYLLWIGTPVAASFAVAIVIASLAGPQWLLTEEKIWNPNYNGTINYNAIDDGMYIVKTTKSSLWILCFTQEKDYHCSKIDYFPKDEYSPDPNDSTMAIPYAIIKSTPFFLISGFILVSSYFVLMMAMCSQRHNVLFFFSGIFFIIAGLIMLIGIIMFISLFKTEIGSKLRPRSMFQSPLFTYRYGHSFVLFVIGCISAEIVGTLNFFLFIQIREIGRERIIPCFMYNTVQIEDAAEKEMNSIKDRYNVPKPYKCQMHPTVPNVFFSPLSQRRYFFEKPTPKSELPRKNLAKSLNELYTDPAPNMFFPYEMPNEFPLTRSVSTTTDIFSNCSAGFTPANNNSHKSLRMYTPQFNKRIISRPEIDCLSSNANYKSISRDGSRDSLNNVDITTKAILTNREKSKDELFVEFCRRAGQRPKPKDIYYIETAYDTGAEKDVFVVENYATIRKNRRNLNVETSKVNNMHNSNLSLKGTNDIVSRKFYPANNLYQTNTFGGSTEATLNNIGDNYFVNSRGNSRDSNVYSSRTLPRDFLKQNINYDVNELCNRRISANGIYTPYNLSMSLPQPETVTIAAPNEFNDRSTEYYKKSYDTLTSRNSHQRDTNGENENTPVVQWPNRIPGSPASFSNHISFVNRIPSKVQDTTQMPTFYSQHFPHQVKPLSNNFVHERNLRTARLNGELENVSTRPNENGNGSTDDECVTFDLDRIESERRKSHANLFQIDTFDSGTPV